MCWFPKNPTLNCIPQLANVNLVDPYARDSQAFQDDESPSKDKSRTFQQRAGSPGLPRLGFVRACEDSMASLVYAKLSISCYLLNRPHPRPSTTLCARSTGHLREITVMPFAAVGILSPETRASIRLHRCRNINFMPRAQILNRST